MAKELSVEQLEIVACCLEAMNGPSGQTKFVSINAPAGYGKIYLARAIASCLRGHDTPFAARQQQRWHQFFTKEVEQNKAPMAYR